MFVVIGQDKGKVAEAAIGPFSKREDAEEFHSLLSSVTTGAWTVLPCHTPVTEQKKNTTRKRRA